MLQGSASNFQPNQILGSKVGNNLATDLQCQVAPWGYLLRKICCGLVPTIFPIIVD